jgi:hypothetical protein
MKSWLAGVLCTLVFAAVCAGSAFAGEVTGKPGATKPTAAPEHANSACAFSGQNDRTPGEGPIEPRVQTPKDGPPGAPGHGTGPGTFFEFGCRGGHNPANPPA